MSTIFAKARMSSFALTLMLPFVSAQAQTVTTSSFNCPTTYFQTVPVTITWSVPLSAPPRVELIAFTYSQQSGGGYVLALDSGYTGEQVVYIGQGQSIEVFLHDDDTETSGEPNGPIIGGTNIYCPPGPAASMTQPHDMLAWPMFNFPSFLGRREGPLSFQATDFNNDVASNGKIPIATLIRPVS